MPVLDVYSHTYEDMLWIQKNFKLYEDPPMLTDEELIIAIYRRFNEAKQRHLSTLGYIKDVKLRGGYTFTYINKYGTNVNKLYNVIKCDEIVVKPNYTIVFKYNVAWSPNNLDDADIYWSKLSEEGKKDLLDASKLSNEMLMDYIRGGYMRVMDNELHYYGYVKDMRIQSVHAFEYLRRNRIGEKEYYLESLYTIESDPNQKLKITVEPGFTIVFSYDKAWLINDSVV